MNCPYCLKDLTVVRNSRSTKSNSQIWRRRECLGCGEIFTTHEVVDLSHLVVVKKSGRVEKFSRVKLFAGIYGAASGSRMPQMEKYIDIITEHVERELLALRKKKLSSLEIGEVVLDVLRREHISTFLRFLSRFKNIITEQQLRSEMKKYLGS